MIDGCFFAARVVAQKIEILYPVYNGVFDYLQAVVYNLYKSIFSTGAAMVQKVSTVTKVLLPIEIQLADTAFYQHDAHFMPMVGVGKERCTLIGPW